MNLIKEIINPEQLDAMFGGALSLDNVELSAILFYDGPNVKFSFTQIHMPSVIPRKWKLKKYNAFSFTLDFINISSVYIDGWEPRMKCSPEIIKEDNSIKLKIQYKKKMIICHSVFLKLDDVFGYTEDPVTGSDL